MQLNHRTSMNTTSTRFSPRPTGCYRRQRNREARSINPSWRRPALLLTVTVGGRSRAPAPGLSPSWTMSRSPASSGGTLGRRDGCARDEERRAHGPVWMAPWLAAACQAIDHGHRHWKSNGHRHRKSKAWWACLALELPGKQHPNRP